MILKRHVFEAFAWAANSILGLSSKSLGSNLQGGAQVFCKIICKANQVPMYFNLLAAFTQCLGLLGLLQ